MAASEESSAFEQGVESLDMALLMKILGHLKKIDTITAAHVSRRWREASIRIASAEAVACYGPSGFNSSGGDDPSRPSGPCSESVKKSSRKDRRPIHSLPLLLKLGRWFSCIRDRSVGKLRISSSEFRELASLGTWECRLICSIHAGVLSSDDFFSLAESIQRNVREKTLRLVLEYDCVACEGLSQHSSCEGSAESGRYESIRQQAFSEFLVDCSLRHGDWLMLLVVECSRGATFRRISGAIVGGGLGSERVHSILKAKRAISGGTSHTGASCPEARPRSGCEACPEARPLSGCEACPGTARSVMDFAAEDPYQVSSLLRWLSLTRDWESFEYIVKCLSESWTPDEFSSMMMADKVLDVESRLERVGCRQVLPLIGGSLSNADGTPGEYRLPRELVSFSLSNAEWLLSHMRGHSKGRDGDLIEEFGKICSILSDGGHEDLSRKVMEIALEAAIGETWSRLG